MASYLSWSVKLFFLLLMLARAPTIDTRPANTASTGDLIAGNEFLKLFLERDELQRELHSREYDVDEWGGRTVTGGGTTSKGKTVGERQITSADLFQANADQAALTSELGGRGAAVRSQNYKSRNGKRDVNAAGDGKQVVKLVTTGSKIVFLEEYDDDDAVVDAVVRDIDLQRESMRIQPKNLQQIATQQVQSQRNSNPSDEVKVVAVSVSSSSKRGGFSRERDRYSASAVMQKQSNLFSQRVMNADIMQQQNKHKPHESAGSSNSGSLVSAIKSAQALTLTTTPAAMPAAATISDDYVNRSHKSEFSIEEAEPLTMSPQKQRASHATRANSPRSLHAKHMGNGRAVAVAAPAAAVHDVDSENSASTNIRNVLASPLVQSASMRGATLSSADTYRSGNRSAPSSLINHNIPSTSHSHVNAHHDDGMNDTVMLDTSAPSAPAAADVEDKLLPFQTVIYHNTKEGHGPQSRSISYSSLSQNVEDLHVWRHAGILAEAQRNVSESLQPIQRAQMPHTSEPAKFYSMPAKMYSEPAKFYSEPAKVYSEPAKVYGEPEKFYSEPAKVYSQPSKVYSEPAKVYSQPAKVYSEPAKTYWAQSASATTTIAAIVPTATTATTTQSPTIRPGHFASSRRPAVVSRIAFGEAQSATATPLAFDEHPPTTLAVSTYQQQQPQHPQRQRQQTRFYPHSQSHTQSHGALHEHSQSHSQSHSSTPAQPQPQSHSAQSQPRRVLFNLDKLPYDLLNAPVQSSQHLLDPDFSQNPPAAVTYSSARQRQCLETAFSISQSAVQQQRQHSSLSDQHSNQNAKGLPNRDLVKCVSKYNQPSAVPSAATESDDFLYMPTPEQNYEIEESVVTNGRAHGVQGIAQATTIKPLAQRPTKLPGRGGMNQHYHGNANTNANVDNNYDDDANVDDPGDGADGSKAGDGDEDAKVAYVVEGRNYRKYRVEEKTDDGFIVGEYGVVDHNDGNLRGVRYTADSTINRSLIQKALLTFLKLK